MEHILNELDVIFVALSIIVPLAIVIYKAFRSVEAALDALIALTDRISSNPAQVELISEGFDKLPPRSRKIVEVMLETAEAASDKTETEKDDRIVETVKGWVYADNSPKTE